MTDDTQLLQDAAGRAKAVLPEPIVWALKRYLEPGDHVPLGADDVARAVLALPAPAVDREGLIELIQRRRPRPAFTHDRWVAVATEIADALIAAGQVGGTHGLTDDEVLALSATAQAFSARIDAALALLDPSAVHHIAGPLADRLRRVLTGQEVPDVPQ